jgi:hypothetical protein
MYLSSNAFTGAFPSEQAPPLLKSCYVMPNDISPCPSAADLADSGSLASRCHLSCPKAKGGLTAGAESDGLGQPHKGKGIPVSPLPGEMENQSAAAAAAAAAAASTGQRGYPAVAESVGPNGMPPSVIQPPTVPSSPQMPESQQRYPIKDQAASLGTTGIRRNHAGQIRPDLWPFLAVTIVGLLL